MEGSFSAAQVLHGYPDACATLQQSFTFVPFHCEEQVLSATAPSRLLIQPLYPLPLGVLVCEHQSDKV